MRIIFDNKKKQGQWLIGMMIILLIIGLEMYIHDDLPYTFLLFVFWLLTGQFALDTFLWIGRQISRLFKR